jgi:hypothetical protein
MGSISNFDDQETDGDIADDASHDKIAAMPTTEGGSGARADAGDSRFQAIVCLAAYLRIGSLQQVTRVRAEGAGRQIQTTRSCISP